MVERPDTAANTGITKGGSKLHALYSSNMYTWIKAATLPCPRKVDDQARIHSLGGSEVLPTRRATQKSEAKLWWWRGPVMAGACGYSAKRQGKHKLTPYVPDKTSLVFPQL